MQKKKVKERELSNNGWSTGTGFIAMLGEGRCFGPWNACFQGCGVQRSQTTGGLPGSLGSNDLLGHISTTLPSGKSTAANTPSPPHVMDGPRGAQPPFNGCLHIVHQFRGQGSKSEGKWTANENPTEFIDISNKKKD